MLNGNEMKAFYRIFIPRKKDDSEHSVGAQDVNETRLNDNFKTVLDEFRKLWDYIKNGFKTKTLEVEGNATIGGNASIGGNTYISGSASVGDRITISDQKGSTTIEGHDYYIGAQANGGLFVPYSVSVQGTDPNNRGVLSLAGLLNGTTPVNITLDPTGTSYIGKDLSVLGDLSVGGDANITGDVNASGNVTGDIFTANSVSVAEDVTVGLDLIVSEDVTVDGVLDVTNRRAQAVLSSPGWYRVMTFAGTSTYHPDGATGALVRFNIVVYGATAVNGNHQIDLSTAYGTGHREFVNELSNGQDTLIDKIRYTKNGNNFYVDVHFTGNSNNTVSVWFDPKMVVGFQARFTSNGLEAVADAPSGETVVKTYTFSQTGAHFGDVFSNGIQLFGLLSGGTAITSNADLNDYINPGVYTCTYAVATTLTNSNITTVGFKMIVMDNGADRSERWQICLASFSNCIIAMRWRDSSSVWQSWKRITPA